MATLDELRLTQLLQPFEGPSGIATLNPLAFQYQNPQYPNSTQMFYQPRMDISPTQDFYQPRTDISPTQDFYQPRMDISPTQDFYQPRIDISPTQDFYQPREFVNAPQDYYQPDLTTLRGLDMNRFQGVSDRSIIDETTNDEQDQNYIDQVSKNKSTGIMDLIMSIAIPGYGFLKNKGGGALDGIRSLNQRIRNTDFAKSSSLADYFDARRYGGRDERDAAAARNMVQARGIQKKIDRGDYGTASAQDKARGQMPSQTISAPKRSFSSDYSAAQRARKF